MKILSFVGNPPQCIKSGRLSVALRDQGIEENVVHTGQHTIALVEQRNFGPELGTQVGTHLTEPQPLSADPSPHSDAASDPIATP